MQTQWYYAHSLTGRLKQGTLPVQCLTAGAATLPSIHNVFSQTLRKHYAYFLNYNAKNVKIVLKLRINYPNCLRKKNLLLLGGSVGVGAASPAWRALLASLLASLSLCLPLTALGK